MTKVTFKGAEGAEKGITNLGMRFVTGVPREVPDRFLDKLQGHPQFEVEGRPYKSAKLVQEEEDLNPEDNEEGEDDRTYTVAELTAVLVASDVAIPKKIANDAQALYDLIEKNKLALPE